jgi:hypothetical protein
MGRLALPHRLHRAVLRAPLLAAAWIYLFNNPTAQALLGMKGELSGFFQVDERFFYRLLCAQGALAFLLTAWVGPGLVAPDLSNGALPLYLCRPFSRAEYVLGRIHHPLRAAVDHHLGAGLAPLCFSGRAGPRGVVVEPDPHPLGHVHGVPALDRRAVLAGAGAVGLRPLAHRRHRALRRHLLHLGGAGAPRSTRCCAPTGATSSTWGTSSPASGGTSSTWRSPSARGGATVGLARLGDVPPGYCWLMLLAVGAALAARPQPQAARARGGAGMSSDEGLISFEGVSKFYGDTLG